MPVTAGRNDPCPCGSGKKYKKCCERVVAIQSAELLREEREQKAKTRLVARLNEWFEGECAKGMDEKWSVSFKELLHLPVDQPIPSNFAYTHRFWMLFDAPCYRGKRPVEHWWKSMVDGSQESERIAGELARVHLCCYEVIRVDGEDVTLRPLTEDREYLIHRVEPIHEGMLMFARLSRLVNRYELFGPYTSFGVEMKGEILMYLKNQVQQTGELKREFWQQNGLQVLGWLMHRAREMEEMEKTVKALPDGISDNASEPVQEETRLVPDQSLREELPRLPVLPEEERGLPEVVEQQLSLFGSKFVEGFQEKTQGFYMESVELLKTYIATYFGKTFTWSMMTGEVLSHFFGVWYVDTGKGGAVKSRIFLNTLKGLFRWLRDEAISDLYPAFVPVYENYIRILPLSYEACRWLKENGVTESPVSGAVTGTVKLAVSGVGASLEIGDRWVPLSVNGRGMPPTWLDQRFWVRGTVVVQGIESSLSSVEAVYPCLQDAYEVEPV